MVKSPLAGQYPIITHTIPVAGASRPLLKQPVVLPDEISHALLYRPPRYRPSLSSSASGTRRRNSPGSRASA
jgi:hypothetical protein